MYFSCETERPNPLPKTGKIVGINLGLITYVQCSDGTKINKPRFFNLEQGALAQAKRRENITFKQEHKKVLAKIHERIKNKRDDFCHKASKKLVDKYDLIAHEDLNAKGMLEQKKFSKSISDAAWSTLILFLTYKAASAGRTIRAVNPRGTSQRCSQCGTVVNKDLSVRVHHCPHCGFRTSRDLNSALEILRLGLESVERPMPRRKAKARVRAHGSPRL